MNLKSPAFGLLGIGFSLGIWIGGSAFLGNYLDGRFETHPVLTLVFLVLGLCMGFYDAYRRLRELMARTESQRQREGRE